MPSQEERVIGQNFDILDRSVAAQWRDLVARPYITQQDYNWWYEGYSSLQYYANLYNYIPYVANQWRDEEPRYVPMISSLQGRIRVGDPRNYDTSVSISGQNGCCCAETEGRGNIGGVSIASGGTNLSLGDLLRDPFTTPAQRMVAETGNDILKGIITALVVGAVLWIAHYFIKKKKKKGQASNA